MEFAKLPKLQPGDSVDSIDEMFRSARQIPSLEHFVEFTLLSWALFLLFRYRSIIIQIVRMGKRTLPNGGTTCFRRSIQ